MSGLLCGRLSAGKERILWVVDNSVQLGVIGTGSGDDSKKKSSRRVRNGKCKGVMLPKVDKVFI